MRIASKTHWLLAALTALALAACGDDDDGGKSVEPTGAGTPITADNAGAVQATVFSTASQAFAKGEGTHDGSVSGTVRVKLNTGKLAQVDIGNLDLGGLAAIRYSLTFKNYSDDGVNWLDGTVDLSVEGANFSYKADLDISGAFDGDVEGDIAVQGGAVTGFWTVDGQRIDF